MPTIYMTLRLSTLHLPAVERLRLPKCGTRIERHKHGARVYVADALTRDVMRDRGFPRLAHLIAYAEHIGCTWVEFDRDALVEPTLPHYPEEPDEPAVTT